MKKELFVKDLKDGASIYSSFIVTKITRKIKKSQRPDAADEEYCQVRLQDCTGSIDGIIWPEALRNAPDFSEADCILVKASVSQFKGLPQLVISSLEKVPAGEVDYSCFTRSIAAEDKEKMILEIRELLSGIKNPGLAQLLDSFFNDSDLFSDYTNSAAAVKYHHAYSGGLLEHSLAVAKNCDMVSRNYPELNRDLLIAGALLHDIGKIEEYRTGVIIKITDEGGLIGHIAIGYGMVLDRIKSIDGFNKALAKNLLHIIISHHGYKEFGSPRVPETPEAFVVYHMDHMDADIFHEKFEAVEQDEQAEQNGAGENDIAGVHMYKKRKISEQKRSAAPRQEELSGF